MIAGYFFDNEKRLWEVTAPFFALSYLYGEEAWRLAAYLNGQLPEGHGCRLEMDGSALSGDPQWALSANPKGVDALLSDVAKLFSLAAPYVFVDLSKAPITYQEKASADLAEAFPKHKVLLYVPGIKKDAPGILIDRRKPTPFAKEEEDKVLSDKAFDLFVDDLVDLGAPKEGALLPEVIIDEEEIFLPEEPLAVLPERSQTTVLAPNEGWISFKRELPNLLFSLLFAALAISATLITFLFPNSDNSFFPPLCLGMAWFFVLLSGVTLSFIASDEYKKPKYATISSLAILAIFAWASGGILATCAFRYHWGSMAPAFVIAIMCAPVFAAVASLAELLYFTKRRLAKKEAKKAAQAAANGNRVEPEAKNEVGDKGE